MKAVESSPTYRLFLYQHRDVRLTHFQIVSYNDSTVSPLILLSYLSSDGTSITYSTKPFTNDLIVKIDNGKVNSREQLSRQDIQKKINSIAQVKFQTLFQKFVSIYEDRIYTELGGETKVPDPDGLSIGLSVDYFSGEIRFRISAFSRVCGSLFTGQINSTGKVTSFIVFYP
jgi:protein-tyrosine-phosphatase